MLMKEMYIWWNDNAWDLNGNGELLSKAKMPGMVREQQWYVRISYVVMNVFSYLSMNNIFKLEHETCIKQVLKEFPYVDNRKHWKPNWSSRGRRSTLRISTKGITLILTLQIQVTKYHG